MRKSKIWFSVSLIATICIVILLVTGSSLLTIGLDTNNSIPSGTFITWMGMISLPLCVYWGVKEFRNPQGKMNTFLSVFLKLILVLAVLWLPISYLLAGNISFSFTEKATFQGGQTAMKWFWRLSYGIPIGAILSLLLYWISSLFRKV